MPGWVSAPQSIDPVRLFIKADQNGQLTYKLTCVPTARERIESLVRDGKFRDRYIHFFSRVGEGSFTIMATHPSILDEDSLSALIDTYYRQMIKPLAPAYPNPIPFGHLNGTNSTLWIQAHNLQSH